jgi:carbon monoxide dehydrogenase subunit G
MRFEGTVEIRASRDRAWTFLTDPNEVGRCGPGVESIDVIDPTHFTATAKVGSGFISARFTVQLELAELEPPNRAVIKAHGQAPGTEVDVTAELHLSDGTSPGSTNMGWAADVAVEGHLAAVGARLIEGTAKKMIGDAFDCLRSTLESSTT